MSVTIVSPFFNRLFFQSGKDGIPFSKQAFFRRYAARNLQHSTPRLTPWATLCRCSAAVWGRFQKADLRHGNNGVPGTAFGARLCLKDQPQRLRKE